MLKPINSVQVELLEFDNSTWNHFRLCKQMSFGSFKNVTYKLFS